VNSVEIDVKRDRIDEKDNVGFMRGFTWRQPEEVPPGDKTPLYFLAGGGVLLGVVLLFVNNGAAIVLGLLLLIGSGYGVFRIWDDPGLPTYKKIVNGLVFRMDGRIGASRRTSDVAPDWYTLSQRIDDIANILIVPMKNNVGAHFKFGWDSKNPAAGYFAYGVAVDFVSGERHYAGEYFDEDSARVVLTQLTQAWQDIREKREAGEA